MAKKQVRTGIMVLVGFIVALVIQEAADEHTGEGEIVDGGVMELVVSYLALFYLLAVVGAIAVRMM